MESEARRLNNEIVDGYIIKYSKPNGKNDVIKFNKATEIIYDNNSNNKNAFSDNDSGLETSSINNNLLKIGYDSWCNLSKTPFSNKSSNVLLVIMFCISLIVMSLESAIANIKHSSINIFSLVVVLIFQLVLIIGYFTIKRYTKIINDYISNKPLRDPEDIEAKKERNNINIYFYIILIAWFCYIFIGLGRLIDYYSLELDSEAYYLKKSSKEGNLNSYSNNEDIEIKKRLLISLTIAAGVFNTIILLLLSIHIYMLIRIQEVLRYSLLIYESFFIILFLVSYVLLYLTLYSQKFILIIMNQFPSSDNILTGLLCVSIICAITSLLGIVASFVEKKYLFIMLIMPISLLFITTLVLSILTSIFIFDFDLKYNNSCYKLIDLINTQWSRDVILCQSKYSAISNISYKLNNCPKEYTTSFWESDIGLTIDSKNNRYGCLDRSCCLLGYSFIRNILIYTNISSYVLSFNLFVILLFNIIITKLYPVNNVIYNQNKVNKYSNNNDIINYKKSSSRTDIDNDIYVNNIGLGKRKVYEYKDYFSFNIVMSSFIIVIITIFVSKLPSYVPSSPISLEMLYPASQDKLSIPANLTNHITTEEAIQELQNNLEVEYKNSRFFDYEEVMKLINKEYSDEDINKSSDELLFDSDSSSQTNNTVNINSDNINDIININNNSIENSNILRYLQEKNTNLNKQDIMLSDISNSDIKSLIVKFCKKDCINYKFMYSFKIYGGTIFLNNDIDFNNNDIFITKNSTIIQFLSSNLYSDFAKFVKYKHTCKLNTLTIALSVTVLSSIDEIKVKKSSTNTVTISDFITDGLNSILIKSNLFNYADLSLLKDKSRINLLSKLLELNYLTSSQKQIIGRLNKIDKSNNNLELNYSNNNYTDYAKNNSKIRNYVQLPFSNYKIKVKSLTFPECKNIEILTDENGNFFTPKINLPKENIDLRLFFIFNSDDKYYNYATEAVAFKNNSTSLIGINLGDILIVSKNFAITDKNKFYESYIYDEEEQPLEGVNYYLYKGYQELVYNLININTVSNTIDDYVFYQTDYYTFLKNNRNVFSNLNNTKQEVNNDISSDNNTVIKKDNKFIFNSLSQLNGNYKIYNIDDLGDYTIVFKKEGYYKQIKSN